MDNTIYRIIDLHTKKQIGKDYTFLNRNKVRAEVDKMDLEYGAYRYIVKPIFKV